MQVTPYQLQGIDPCSNVWDRSSLSIAELWALLLCGSSHENLQQWNDGDSTL